MLVRRVIWKNSRLHHELDPEQVAATKQQPGKAMIVFGSGSIASQSARLRLVAAKEHESGAVVLRSAR